MLGTWVVSSVYENDIPTWVENEFVVFTEDTFFLYVEDLTTAYASGKYVIDEKTN